MNQLPRILAASLALSLAVATVGPRAYAEDEAAARTLFEDATKLVAQKQYDQACPKFESSYQLKANPKALFFLADCYEKQGRSASAWTKFLAAAASYDQLGKAGEAAAARKRADDLSKKLAKLTIHVTEWVAGMEVKRGDDVVGKGQCDTALPIDPSTIVVTATATNKKSFRMEIAVPAGPSETTVTVPALEDDAPKPVVASDPATTAKPSSTTGVAVTSTAAPSSPRDVSSGEAGDPGSGRRSLGLVVGAVGLVGLGLGTVVALSGKSKYDGACTQPPPGRACVDDADLQTANDGTSRIHLGLLVAGVGAAALATGVVVFLTAPKKDAGASIAITPTGLLVQGRF